ncbi:ROK family transcriptional regulator [Alkaliflexus imshenetskii]|uniref:ROK family transcriptional regulator n=1 Tax=Alkaliflexus imshenetskii TaxID=286730 RepID=UPI00047CAA1D|nr:ROK family transcriptional regulator [Alkaliflexus imshenetskii]
MKIDFLENVLTQKLSGLEQKKFIASVKIIKDLYVNGPQPIANICKQLKISSPNAFAILSDLIERGVIERRGYGESNGGRKPELYRVKDDAFYIVGIDMDIYQTRFSLFNGARENITGIKACQIPLNNDIKTLNKLIEEIDRFIKESGIERDKIVGVGLSFPGLVDAINGINYTYLHFGARNVRDVLQEHLKIPVFVENDAKAISLAVWRFGVAKGRKNVLVLYLDWGIGMGMILNGRLYRGANGFSGEFSHIPVVENGDLCICGKLGCLQTIAAGTALVKLVEEGVKSGKSSLSSVAENGNSNIDVKSVVKAALNGDQYCINTLSAIGKNLGRGISILIQLYNPEMIVLGGAMAEAGHYLTTPIQQAINTYSISQISDGVKMEVSKMGKEIGVNGAMAVAMEDVFDLFLKNHK